ncbi:hypothetical protein BHM03_00030482 [Ensete ventricosum]|nr:hypothetical protein BHM03_00030482 [Ensete ventricosum]
MHRAEVRTIRLGTRQECVRSLLRVLGVCQDGVRKFVERRPRLVGRLSGVAERLARSWEGLEVDVEAEIDNREARLEAKEKGGVCSKTVVVDGTTGWGLGIDKAAPGNAEEGGGATAREEERSQEEESCVAA